MRAVWAAASPLRRRYAGLVAAIWLLQTLARLALARAAGGGTDLQAAALHLALILALLCLLVLAFASVRLALGRSGWATAAALLLAAAVHALLTAFDLLNLASFELTGQRADVRFLLARPILVLALLDNVGIGLVELVAAAAALAALHLLLYIPLRHLLPDLALAAAGARLRAGRERLPAAAALLALVAGAAILYWRGPAAVLRGEPFWEARRGVFQFQMAPRSLLDADAAPRSRPGPPAPPPPESRPLVLIVVDALRRDRMGVYDPTLDTTPFLTGLARRGRLHRYDAWATCTFSLCGVMSLLASRSWNDFGSRPETLIDRLAAHSYDSHLILAGRHRDFGPIATLYGDGIASLADQPAGDRPDDRWLLDRLRRLDIADPRRTFLYLHLMSAHAGGYLEPAFRVHPDDDGGFGGSLLRLHDEPTYRLVYDGRVRQTDEIIRRIFVLLGRKGLLDEALVVIASDHGERVGDGTGRLYHGGEADMPTLAVPLIVYDGRGGAWPARPLASQVDVAPTLLAAIGLPPAPGWRGEALQRPTGRQVVPVGTWSSSGAVVAWSGSAYLYLCRRATGEEAVTPLAEAPPPARALPPLRLLRQLHRVTAAPVPDACPR